MSLQDIILQRKSVRHYDPNYAIERKEILDSIELAAKSPNGNNIQSTRYLLIEDKELRAKVKPIAYNQEQVETSSYLILILGITVLFILRISMLFKTRLWRKVISPKRLKRI